MSIPESEIKRNIEKINEISGGYGFQSIAKVFHVKNYSPGIEHFVFDILVK
jgi:tRNA G37 N-methylase Trm5